MPFVRMRDGQRIHVRTLGRGAPCLLVHGFASDSAAWLPFVAPLLHRYQFVMPDLRGFGKSRAVPLSGTCPLTCYARDLADVAAALGLSQAPAVGMSMGALSTVQAFRLGEAGRIGRYMHVDQGPAIRNREDYPHGLLGAAQPGFFARMRSVVETLESRPGELTYAALPPETTAQLAQVFAEFSTAAFTAGAVRSAVGALTSAPRLLPYFLPDAGFATYVQIMRAYLDLDYDLREAFREVRVPLTLLIGGASRMYPPAGQRSIVRFAPHAEVCELTGVGHMLPLEAPRHFLQQLERFLSRP
jgi:non-heme chloroperoxidase